jgi:hypothetical protein
MGVYEYGVTYPAPLFLASLPGTSIRIAPAKSALVLVEFLLVHANLPLVYLKLLSLDNLKFIKWLLVDPGCFFEWKSLINAHVNF